MYAFLYNYINCLFGSWQNNKKKKKKHGLFIDACGLTSVFMVFLMVCWIQNIMFYQYFAAISKI